MQHNDMNIELFKNRSFLFLLFLFLVVRIGFFIIAQPWSPDVLEHNILQGDATDYHVFALRILGGLPIGDTLGTQRTPGYPLYLAGVYAVFGVAPWVALLLQIILSATMLFMLYGLSCHWFNQKAAIFAGLFYALEPHVVLYSSYLLTDTLFSVFFLGSLVMFLVALETRKGPHFFLVGLLIGILTLIRPVGEFLPVLFIVLGFIMLQKNRMTVLRGCVVLLIAYFMTVSPWLYRNYHEYGVAKLTSKGGEMLLNWTIPYVEVARTGKEISVVRQEFVELARQQGLDQTNNPFEKSRIQTAVATAYIMQHPIEYAMGTIRGVAYSFVNLDTIGYANFLGMKSSSLPGDWYAGDSFIVRLRMFVQTKTVGEIVIGSLIIFLLSVAYFLFFVGAWSALRNRNYWPVLITCSVIAYFMMFIGPIGAARYKLPFIPLYLALAGYGFSRMSTAWSNISVR